MKAHPPAARAELSRGQLEAAERGFKQLLRRKRFSREFIDRNAADLLAQARLEYSRHLAAGKRIDNAAGWIIHCAWRRTQNALEQEANAPRYVPIAARPGLAAKTTTPEEEALEADRHRQLQAAVEELSPEQLKLIALTYFGGMSVREASRALGWDKCKGDRRHHAALKRLKQLLGVEDLDALGVEIGLAAFAVAGAGGRTGPAGFATHTVSRAAAELLARGQELARRLLAGGAAEPGMGNAAGLAARGAGACAAAAVACLASGVIGPGIGGLDVVGHQPAPKHAVAHRDTAAAQGGGAEAAAQAPPSWQGAASAQSPEPKPSAKRRKPVAQKASRRRSASSPASTSAASGRQVEEEFTPFAGEPASGESSGQGTAAPTESSSGESGGGGSTPRRASGAQVESEFGL
jgi:RNA polymerase sigma factor (sigma-70 family)